MINHAVAGVHRARYHFVTMAETDLNHAAADDVLTFWFGAGSIRGQSRSEWFRKDPAFDEEIRARFLGLHEEAARGECSHWHDSADSCLALVVVLDQFPRNMFRNAARAFFTDPLARATARHALSQRFDNAMRPVERMFMYLPFEHSESIADQDLCAQLMQPLAAFPETRDIPLWAEKHRTIIARFGRFPHRNAALGRASTPEELAFLKQPGSGF